MKKIYFLIVLFGALLFCACEKENIDPLVEDQAQSQTEESALKGADENGMIKMDLTPWPMVARMGAGSEYVIPANDEYGVIIFYVNNPLDPNFKDHNFYDPSGNNMGWYVDEAWALPKEDFSIAGSSWWLPDYPAPHHYHAKGKGDVLVWIITFDQVITLYNTALNNTGELTINNIAELEPWVGHATSYNEVLRPYGGGAPVFGGEFNARGTLETWEGEDRGKFIFSWKTKAKPGESMTSNLKLQIIYK